MQTLFRNPLAGPYVLGNSSGASLGVALVVLAGIGSSIGIAGAAWVGAAVVLEEIERTYLDEFDTFVAHNVPFDRSCLHHSAEPSGRCQLGFSAEKRKQHVDRLLHDGNG